MLTMNKKIILTGKTVIDGVDICGYQAQIDSVNPTNIAFTSWKNNNEKYKEHREQCRDDLAAFEDRAFEIQDEMLRNLAATDTEKATETE